MNVFFIFLAAIVNASLLYLLLQCFHMELKKKNHNLISLFWGAMLILEIFEITMWIAGILLFLILCLVFRKESHCINRSLLMVVLFFYLLEITQLFSITVLWCIHLFDMKQVVKVIQSLPGIRSLLDLVCKVVLLLLFVLIKRKENNKVFKSSTRLDTMLLGMLLCSIIAMRFLSNLSSGMDQVSTQIYFIFIAFIASNLIGVILFFYAKRYYSNYQEEQMKLLYEKKSVQYLEKAARSNENLQKIWHDIGNYKTLLKLRNHENETELSGTFDTLEKQIEMITGAIKTGNKLADVIFNDKRNEAIHNNIRFEVKALLPPILPMYDTDLCSLLFNTIDNAIEANEGEAEKDKMRYVSIDSNLSGNFLFYQITNSCSTWKKEDKKKLHPKKYIKNGFGLQILGDIVEKYDGEMKTEKNEDSYCLTVILHFHDSDNKEAIHKMR